jgi:hypothetical protein
MKRLAFNMLITSHLIFMNSWTVLIRISSYYKTEFFEVKLQSSGP